MALVIFCVALVEAMRFLMSLRLAILVGRHRTESGRRRTDDGERRTDEPAGSVQPTGCSMSSVVCPLWSVRCHRSTVICRLSGKGLRVLFDCSFELCRSR